VLLVIRDNLDQMGSRGLLELQDHKDPLVERVLQASLGLKVTLALVVRPVQQVSQEPKARRA